MGMRDERGMRESRNRKYPNGRYDDVERAAFFYRLIPDYPPHPRSSPSCLFPFWSRRTSPAGVGRAVKALDFVWPARQVEIVRRGRMDHGPAHDAAVPRRSCRQPAPSAAAAGSSRSAKGRHVSQPPTCAAIEDEAIREVVKLQEEIGLQGVTDGEFRRASWHMDFLYQVGGVTKVQDNLKVQFRNEQGVIEFTPAALRIKGKLKLDKCIFGDDFQFLKSVAQATPKLTIPSPSMMHYRGGRAAIDPAVYPDFEEFWHDLARSMPTRSRARQARLHLSAARRHQPRLSQRSDAARDGQQDGRGRRARAASRLYPDAQRGAGREACRHDDLHASVPRQFPLVVGRFGRLRSRGRGAVRRAQRGWFFPRVRRRPLRQVRAAALRAQGQEGRAGTGHDQEGALEKKDG